MVHWVTVAPSTEGTSDPKVAALLKKYGPGTEWWGRVKPNTDLPLVLGYWQQDGRFHFDMTVMQYARSTAFMQRKGMTSRKMYLRLIFSFLEWSKKPVAEIDAQDFDMYKTHRRQVLGRSGATWNKDHAALYPFFKWVTARGELWAEESPVPPPIGEDKSGRRVQGRATDDKSQRVRWATPGTLDVYRDVAWGGHVLEGSPKDGYTSGEADESLTGFKYADRNLAWFDVVRFTGLRLREARSMLTIEHLLGADRDVQITATAKNSRPRRWRSPAQVNQLIQNYKDRSRKIAVAKGKTSGLYDRWVDPLIVTSTSHTTYGLQVIYDTGEKTLVRELTEEQRLRLLERDGQGRLQPLWLWLGQNGEPLRRWDEMFTQGNRRMESEQRRLGAEGDFVVMSAHALRFSYGLLLLLALHREIDSKNQREGKAAPDRRYVYDTYDGAYAVVQQLLGHNNIQTTKDIYLEVLEHDFLWRSDLALSDGDVVAVLAHLAERSGGAITNVAAVEQYADNHGVSVEGL